MSAFKVFNEEKNKVVDHKKLKGVKKNVVKKEVTFDHYYQALMGERKEDIQQMSKFILSGHLIMRYTLSLYPKVGLSSGDDKRFIRDHVNTYAYGHYRIKNLA